MANQRILVVEDSVLLRKLACQMLEMAGYDTAEAANGAEALARASRGDIDLVLSDRVMAPIDGLDLLSRLRATTTLAHLPFVMMSGDPTPEATTHALQAGVDAFVAKPFSREQLVRQIGAVLERRRAAA